VLGLPSLVLFGLAYMVPLTVWTTYGVVVTQTHGFLTTAYIVTTVAMVFTAYSCGRMVVMHPVARLTFEIALSWVAVGFVYLLFLTRMFRREPPAMYSGDEEGDELVSAPARA
jgi:hypothetical protein